MKLSDKLRARRAELALKMRAMVDALTTENRDFTAEERSAFDGHKADLAKLDQQIADAVAVEEAERGSEGQPIAGGGAQRQLAEGEVRALRPEQRMFDLVPAQEGPPLSLGRMVRAALTGNWTDAEAERRAMGENTGSVGGFMVPGALSATVIDLARNQSAFVNAGALTIPMDAPEMTVIKVLTDPTPQWREEHQAVTESDATFGPIRLKSKLLGCICRVSLELMEDAPRFSQTIENAISQSIALELDRVGLFGNGASEPRGLNSTDGISSVSMGVNGATPDDYDEYLDAILAIENANGVPGAVIMAPRTKRTLSGLKTGISGDKTPLVPPAEFTALKRLVSNQIPITQAQGSAANCSTSFVGDFAQAAVAMRTGLTIEATRVGGTGTFSQFQALIRAYIRADIAVFRPTFFSRIVGIKP